MSEPIGIVSGGLAFAGVTYKATTALYEELCGYRKFPREVKELKSELKHLNAQLNFLQSLQAGDLDDFVQLESALLRCRDKCQELLDVLSEIVGNNQGFKSNVKDWWRWRSSKEDIVNLTKILSREKSMITMTIAGLNLSKHVASACVIDEYQAQLLEAISDTKSQLSAIDEQIRTIQSSGPGVAIRTGLSHEELRSQRDKCEENLAIFESVLKLLHGLQPSECQTVMEEPEVLALAQEVLGNPTAGHMTMPGIRDFEAKIPYVISSINLHINTIREKLEVPENRSTGHRGLLDQERKVEKDRLAALERLSKRASQKRANVFEDIHTAHNSQQKIISTCGELISAKNITTQQGANMLLGQLTDESLQLQIQSEISTSKQSTSTAGAILCLYAPLLLLILVGYSHLMTFFPTSGAR